MAGSIVVGILKALLTSDTAQFDSGMRKAAATSKSTSRAINANFAGLSQSAASFAKTFAGAFGLSLTVGAVVAFGKQIVSAASDVADLSKKTGLSAEAIQRMQFVADQTGTSLEAMTEASFRLGVRLSGGGSSVRKAAHDLNLEWAALRAQSPEEQFNTIVAALARVGDASERNRIGVELFGKSFSSIAAAVAQDYAKIASAATVATQAQIEALDKADDRIKGFLSNVRASITIAIADELRFFDALKEIEAEDAASGDRRSKHDRGMEAMRRVTLGLVGARRGNIEITTQAATVEVTYAERLRQVRAELAKLTPAQRAEIAAAQQLGVSAGELEDKYGLTEGALRLLTTATKGHLAVSKDANAELYALSVAAIANQDAWNDLSADIDKNMLAVRRWSVEAAAARQEALAFFTAANQLENLPSLEDLLFPNAMLENGADTSTGRFGDVGTTMGQSILSSLKGSLGGLNDIFQSAFEGGGNLRGAVKSFSTNVLSGLLNLVPGVGPILAQFSGAIMAGLEKIGPKILSGFKKIGGFFKRIFGFGGGDDDKPVIPSHVGGQHIPKMSFATGGFVPPGAVMTATLHGGSFGEDIVPRSSAGGGGHVTNIYINASQVDTAGMAHLFKTDIIPRIKNALVFNQHGLLSTAQRTVG